MNADALIWVVLGLLIGWALHWLLDFFFWRNKRVCTEYEQELETTIGVLRQENTSLSADVTALNARVGRAAELETALAKQKAEYNDLLVDFNARGCGIRQAQS